MADIPGVKNLVQNAEPELRAALQDMLQRFGGNVALEVQLPGPANLEDDRSWEGNVYKYSF